MWGDHPQAACLERGGAWSLLEGPGCHAGHCPPSLARPYHLIWFLPGQPFYSLWATGMWLKAPVRF